MTLPISRSAWVRIAPFAVFMLLLAVRGSVPAMDGFDQRWLYGLSVILAGGLLLAYRREFGELARANAPTLAEAGLAVVVGVVVFVLWIRLDAPWMQLAPTAVATYVPLDAGGALQWPQVAMRLAGAVLLVPVMEELFWRSFLMRWIESATFEGVDPRRVGLKAVVLSTFVFMLAHTLWLAAIVAGLAYAWLYRRSGKLWVPVIAHAVTNALLGAWVIATGSWAFW